MEKKATYYFRNLLNTFFILIALMFVSSSINAQISCANENVFWLENFGAGTTASSDSDVLTSGLTYQALGPLANEGVYRTINNTQQKPEWHVSADHTGNGADGKMLVVNGQAETFFQHQIVAQGFAEGSYTASLYLMNVDTMGICGPNALLPAITFNVEYLSQAGTWMPLNGSPFTAAPVAQSQAATWVNLGSTFTLPPTGNFVVTKIRVTLSDGTTGGCGNDFAMDDVKFAFCPEGGPTPVTFLGITANQKGSGVSVDWSTSQEINSGYFEVQKSADGNSNWGVVSTVNAAGNSQVVKKYNAYDANPLSGINYYRIKEVDKDGNFNYSKTVNVKLDIAKTGISVLANPFHSSLTVDFQSSTNQIVSARLIDITGKQIAIEKWSITAGNTRKDFSNVGGLQSGIYILSVSNNMGEILFNSKVIKQ
ncbi:MAG: T9SS type A sorting domain-containing protein [Bacteroidota bacterium]|nr:T9SS type A sorting domain-containing protein [Bacteroidota bacterium]